MKSFLVLTAMASVCLAQDYSNGQAARLVIGQSTFTEADVGAQNNLLGAATGVAYANGTLFVVDGNRFTADPNNNRVLLFPTKGDTNGAAPFPGPLDDPSLQKFRDYRNNFPCYVCVGYAGMILGQPDFNNNAVNLTQAGFRSPVGVATDGVRLVVADTDNNRVMIWNSIPTRINQPADIVVGQVDFVHNTTKNPPTATSMRGPQGVWIAGGKLFVADTQDNRVLIYNTIPTANNATPDVVIGQPNFTTAIPAAQVTINATQSNLASPVAVTTDGIRMIVTDLAANRVMIWNKIPTSNGTPADVEVGQKDFVSATYNDVSNLCATTGTDSAGDILYPSLCEKTLSFPRFAISDGTRLYIADGGNDRVLIYSTIPTTNAVAADHVLGQADFVTDVSADGASEMYTPTALALDGTNLYVSDCFNRRILAFTPAAIPLGVSAMRNAASLEVYAIGTITIAGTITAKDTVSLTIDLLDANSNTVNTATYTYTVQTNDSLDDIVNGLTIAINKTPGDPNVTAIADTSIEAVILTAKVGGAPGTLVNYSTTVSTNATETATTAGTTLALNLEDATQIAPGSLVTIFGDNLSDISAVGQPDSGGYYPFSLAGVDLFIDGIRAPLVSVAPGQINAQMPYATYNRTSISAYVRVTHADGTITTSTPEGVSIVIANPGIFAQTGAEPRVGYVYHAYQNATGAISVDGVITAGDVGTMTIGTQTYTYTVQETDTLQSVQQAFVSLINSDPGTEVTAYPSNVFTRILLVALQPGTAGESLAITATVPTGTGLILTALSSVTCCSSATGGLVTDNNPAQAGETLYIYATGLGVTNLGIPTGQIAGPNNVDQPVTPIDSILAGGSTANILFTDYVPGQLGTFKVTFQINESLAADPLTQLTIAQQSFVSNVVTFNVTATTVATAVVATVAPRKTSDKPPVRSHVKKRKKLPKVLQHKV